MSRPAYWFKDFLGVGYRYHDVYMNVFPLFQDKMPAFRLWKKTIEWWPDDQIRLRFVEHNASYWFILYGGSDYNKDNTGFVKKMPVSEYYERFKAGFEKKAILRFGIYKKNRKKNDASDYDLEVLKKSKSVYDVAFLKYEDLDPNSVEWQCIQENES
ncbi:MAG TPA: hypothetical protein VNI77_07555 [Nitrososphaera sp.]|nr:hypothetical protein [Nitrososphaera sp.]